MDVFTPYIQAIENKKKWNKIDPLYIYNINPHKVLTQTPIIKKMSTFQIQKPQKYNNPIQPRLSITNIPNIDRIERYDKYQKQKPIDKIKKSIQRAQNTLKQYQFQLFDLRQLEENYMLIKNNRKFSTLLNTMKIYNKKLEEKRQHDIINYKLHQFYYSTLRICNTKTQTEVQYYLEEINSWLNRYNHKRQLIIHPNKKYMYKKDEDDVIRQTFKSNLPLEVNQYKRRLCVFTAPKDKKIKDRLTQKQKKMNTSLGKFDTNKDKDNSDEEYIKGIVQDIKQCQKNNKNKELQLPNLRAYRAEILKVRKARQDRDQALFFQNLKKNQSRNLTQSSNNFYKPLRNRHDLFIKSYRQNQEGCTYDASQKTRKLLQQNDSSNNSRGELEDNSDRDDNHRVIVNSTSMGFYQIKKKNLNKALGLKNTGLKVTFPKFFMRTDGYFNQENQNLVDTGAMQSANKQNNVAQVVVPNISGLSLLKNPIQVTKPKKQKKSK